MQRTITEFRKAFNAFLDAFISVQRSDAFINILNAKSDYPVLEQYGLSKLLKNVVKRHPDLYLDALFLVDLVTILEEYLKNRLIEEFRRNEQSAVRFIQGYNIERKLTVSDIIAGPQNFAVGLLGDLLFHNLPKVERVYSLALDIDLKTLCNFKALNILVKTRHTIVHERGTLVRNKLTVNRNFLIEDIQEVNRFVENIEFYILNRRLKKRHRDIIAELHRGHDELIPAQDGLIYEFAKLGGI